jgi:3-oxoacyl-[acyl-carrier protein] reductase
VTSPALQEFRGKVALITGASRGIGRRLADAFGSSGASVFLVARNASDVRAAADELQSRGIDAAFYAGSAAAPDDIATSVSACMERFARIDVLVNNAGRDVTTSLLDPDWDEVEAMWQLNYFGPWRFIRATWHAHMREHGGSVINIASSAANKSRPVLAAYGMSKAALVDLTRRMAAEVGPTVRVNAISPGTVPTDLVRDLFARIGPPPGVDEHGRGPWPLRRPGTLDDVAAAALYLASPNSSWVTGQVLHIDGGAHLS